MPINLFLIAPSRGRSQSEGVNKRRHSANSIPDISEEAEPKVIGPKYVVLF